MSEREHIIRDAFRQQGNSCRRYGSEFTARLCHIAAENLDPASAVGTAIFTHTGDASAIGDAVPLRFTGALHALVLSEKAAALASVYPPHHGNVSDAILWHHIADALQTHADFVIDRLQSAPQTNEVGRSAVLLPGFLTIATLFQRPLALYELGASAGLNLLWDKYSYQLDDFHWGERSAPVALQPRWDGAQPPDAQVTVVSRHGCDLNPLNPAETTDRLRMLAYIWPDQPERLQRTDAALNLAASLPHRVDAGDAAEWLAHKLTPPQPDVVQVVYHTVAWQYFPAETQAHARNLIESRGKAASADTPLAWLSMEADGAKPAAALNLRVWPPDRTERIATADFHGRWIQWHGW